MLSQLSDAGWSPPATVIEDPRMLTNWADVPAAHRLPSGHWLVAYPQFRRVGGRDYGLAVVHLNEAFRALDRWVPDDVARGPETGFIDFVGDEEGATMLWLDGREMHPRDGRAGATATDSAPSEDDSHAAHGAGAMTLRALRIDTGGQPVGPSTLLDARTCECCKLDGARGTNGPWVVYRDRDDHERRDIRAVAMRIATDNADGDVGRLFVEQAAEVHHDGWIMAGCPVNGPALARTDTRIFAAWFSAPHGNPRVSLSHSAAGVPNFTPPVRMDLGEPVGRVDLIALDDGEVLVTWLEGDADQPGRGTILTRRITASGEVGPPLQIHEVGVGRDWGFPRARTTGDAVIWIWTHAEGPHTSLRGARLDLAQLRTLSDK